MLFTVQDKTRQAYLDVLLLRHELDVERTRYVKGLADGRCHTLDAADGLDPQLLSGEEEGGVSGVYTGILSPRQGKARRGNPSQGKTRHGKAR